MFCLNHASCPALVFAQTLKLKRRKRRAPLPTTSGRADGAQVENKPFDALSMFE
jgi:hypothetical protein